MWESILASMISIIIWLFIIFILDLTAKLTVVIVVILLIPVFVIYFNFIDSLSNDVPFTKSEQRDIFLVLIIATGLIITLAAKTKLKVFSHDDPTGAGKVFITAIVLVALVSIDISFPVNDKVVNLVKRDLEGIAVILIIYSLYRHFIEDPCIFNNCQKVQ